MTSFSQLLPGYQLPKVYPNFLDVPHSVLQQCEEKLRAPLMHTGTPSAYSLIYKRLRCLHRGQRSRSNIHLVGHFFRFQSSFKRAEIRFCCEFI